LKTGAAVALPMSEVQKFDSARETQWLWKTEAMQRMAMAVVELALRLAEFSANDLDPAMEHGGPGIAGSIFAKLEMNGIIERVGVWSSDGAAAPKIFYPKLRPSRRDGSKCGKIGVYHLADAAKARAFLRAQHSFRPLRFRQAELLPA